MEKNINGNRVDVCVVLLPVDVYANYASFSVDCIVYLSAWFLV